MERQVPSTGLGMAPLPRSWEETSPSPRDSPPGWTLLLHVPEPSSLGTGSSGAQELLWDLQNL